MNKRRLNGYRRGNILKTKRSQSCLLIVLILMAFTQVQAQTESNRPYRVEEITVQAGDFTVVGDLYLPTRGDRHPAVVWVHGSGPMTRQNFKHLIQPQIDLFLKAGFALFLDDIPGNGGSKGEIKNVFSDRALILAKEVGALKARPDILPDRIGVAGVSQAGIVMPLATTMTSDIAFMIAEACVAEAAYKQDAYLLEHLMLCEGRSAEEAREMSRLQRRRYETDDFLEYRAAAERLNANEYCKLIGLDNPAFASEEKFKARDKSPSRLSSYFDPMPLVAAIKFPILAVFGEKDNNIDPVQGAEAYRQAFKTASNALNRVETIPNANHMLYEATTGCARELLAQVAAGKPLYGPRVLEVLAEWLERFKAQRGS